VNRPLVRVLLFVIVTTLLAGCYLRPLPGTEEHGDEKVIIEGLNGYVLDIISGYEGDYPYLLNDDYENYNGVTEDLIYQGEIIAKANPSGDRASHCVGLTFEVFFKAMQARNLEHGRSPDDFGDMTLADMEDFILTWYVAGDRPRELNNLAAALERSGLGERLTDFEEAKIGDFVQYFRANGTGHAVVLVDWIRAGDTIIGMTFWSTQQSTDGIGYTEAYFQNNPPGTPQGTVSRENVYIGRVI
jgi:hypothetical protein